MPNVGPPPDGWTLEPLSQCVDVLDGRRRPINSKDRATRVGTIPYYGATGQVGWIDDFLFNEELVLVGEDGAPFFDKSKQIAYLISGKTWVNNHAHVLRARVGVTSNRYLKHYLDSFDFTGLVQGSTRDKLTQRAMNGIPVLLAPRDIQDKIVKTIDAVLEGKASATRHLAVARRAIERFRQALLMSACSGQLTAAWRDAHLVDRATEQSNSHRPLIDAPDEWTWSALGELADIRGGIQVGAKRKAIEVVRAVPYLRVANVQRGWLDLSEIKMIAASDATISNLRLEAGDILFNEGGDRDKLGRGWVWEGQIAECIHQNHVFRARLTDPRMQPRFFSWFGNTFGMLYFFEQGKQTVNLASLSKTKLSQLPVPVPSIEEQAEIVRRVETLLETADHLSALLQSATKHTDRSSQAVLAKAFRGELVEASP
jgi:type I restriction enzyme, S subunit